MKRAEKEVGRFVQKITSFAFRQRYIERKKKQALEKTAMVGKIIDLHLRNQELETPISIPPAYLQLIREQRKLGQRERGHPRGQSPEQIAQDEITVHAMCRLMRDGWSETAAAERVGRLIGRTRQATVEGYRRGFMSYLVQRGWTPTEVEYRIKSTRKLK
jgi:hypothetical protein